ncbi:MAG: LytTR family two component transcriptional regulator [Bacteroidetes bacterium]|nr:MAG: LytTR family two component transcriptional regulator [Bacteroidota bacterium]
MIRAIAIDDELPALKIIENFCAKTDFITLDKTFNKPSEALKHIRKFPVDLLFLDINMPSMSGIDLYKSIGQNAMVIFTTAYSEYAAEGFELDAVDYIVKPFTYERFLKAAAKAQEYYKFKHKIPDEKERVLFIRADYSLIKINIDDILYIEGLDDYVRIFLQNQRPVVARMTLKALQIKLPSGDFIRVHRSFIIPFARIESVRNKIISCAGQEIPVGNSYEASFFAEYKNKYGNSI